MIWFPIVCTGDRLVMGSWKIMEISLPRMRLMSLPKGSKPRRFTCSPFLRRIIVPERVLPGLGTMRIIDCAVTLLPQPLSPMTPSVPFSATEKLTPSTAFRTPSSR